MRVSVRVFSITFFLSHSISSHPVISPLTSHSALIPSSLLSPHPSPLLSLISSVVLRRLTRQSALAYRLVVVANLHSSPLPHRILHFLPPSSASTNNETLVVGFQPTTTHTAASLFFFVFFLFSISEI